MKLPVMNRACGECTICCDVVGVEGVGKPYFARCKHLSAGCNIYEHRPKNCSDYSCAWLQGALSEDDRPDKSGLLFSPEEGGLHVYILTKTPDLKATIRTIMEKTAGIRDIADASPSMKHKILIYLPGQVMPVPWDTPDYDCNDPIEPSEMATTETSEYIFFTGPWREMLFPKKPVSRP